jgi:Phosphotransferase enzyme family
MHGEDCFSANGGGKQPVDESVMTKVDSKTEAQVNGLAVSRISPLELFHPAGTIERFAILGRNCPLRLLPRPDYSARDHADLIVLAPQAVECSRPSWLQEAVHAVDQQLAPDGIVYVLAPRRWRWAIEHLLRDKGLLTEMRVAHFPNWESSRYLVPLNTIPSVYAFSKLMPVRAWRRRLALGALSLPSGGRLLTRILPWIGLVARRPNGRSLFDWLFMLDGDACCRHSAIVSTSWQGEDRSIVLHRFSGLGHYPSAVVKMPRATESDLQIDEAATLARIGPGVRLAGADVPKPLLTKQIGKHRAFMQSVVNGRSAATLLASQPQRLNGIIERVSAWLERWNLATKVMRPFDRGLIDKAILAPVMCLAPHLQHGLEYRDWLVERCATINDPVPLVAAHNDLTVWNVLLDEQGRLGVVDWESAQDESLPLIDLFYAVVDAVAVAKGLDRFSAFKQSCAPGGAHEQIVIRFLKRDMRALGITTRFAELCLHACFLHHAANEQRVREPDDPQPFFQIVQWLAENRFSHGVWVTRSG